MPTRSALMSIQVAPAGDRITRFPSACHMIA
jgi:hypothetical protein